MLSSRIALVILAALALARAGATQAVPSSPKEDLLPELLADAAGIEVLAPALTEAQVRNRIRKAAAGAVFLIPPGASWVLTDTLHIPAETTLVGFSAGRSNSSTFTKGFDGPLAMVDSWVTLYGITFNGAKEQFKGDGLVDPKVKGVREQRFIRVEVRGCAGSGFVFRVPHYYSYYQFCTFDRNDEYGLVYGEVRSHHTDNNWESCHIGWNGKGGVAFHGVEASSIWEHCEFFHNGGPVFEQFLISKKLGAGKEIGERPKSGCEDLVIRSCVIRNSAGPVWLQRGGQASAIVFEDCRLKHNGDPKDCDLTKEAGKTKEELLGVAGPVGGLFHVEEGQLCVEIRGGFAYDNGQYMFTTSPKSAEGSRLTISGAAQSGGVGGGIHAPNAYLTALDASLLAEDAEITVKSGIGLDPRTGQVVRYPTGSK